MQTTIKHHEHEMIEVTYSAYSAGYMDYGLEISVINIETGRELQIFDSPHHLSSLSYGSSPCGLETCNDCGFDDTFCENRNEWSGEEWERSLINLVSEDAGMIDEFIEDARLA